MNPYKISPFIPTLELILENESFHPSNISGEVKVSPHMLSTHTIPHVILIVPSEKELKRQSRNLCICVFFCIGLCMLIIGMLLYIALT